MSSDSEMSIVSASSTDAEDRDDMEDEESDDEVLLSNVTPYQDEPLAEADQTGESEDEEANVDGLTPAVLEARYEKEVSVSSWLVLSLTSCH